jgi:hypothetical protein
MSLRRVLVVCTALALAAPVAAAVPASADVASPSSSTATASPSSTEAASSASGTPGASAVPTTAASPTATVDQAAGAQAPTVDNPAGDVPAAAPRAVALSVPPSTVVLRTVALSGVVEGEPATGITLERRLGTVWTPVATGAVAPTGEWSMSWVADTPGTVALRATTSYADGTTVSSAAASMLVVAAIDAMVSGPLVRTDVPTSYRNGCPVGPDRLRRLVVNYWDYQGKVRRGTLVVVASAAPVVQRAFTRAFADRFRIKKIVPVDAYYGPGVTPTGSDVRAMNDGNTSAFNCRGVTGSRFRVSQHSYGNAIDINTFENPYVTSSKVYPAKAKKRYVKNRSKHLGDPGVLRRKSGITRVFLKARWSWGGFWAHRDWQHFSVNGR